jgi:hypothetical protein
MKYQRFLVLGLLATACSPSARPNERERVGIVANEVFANGDFEGGAANNPPTSWTVDTYMNNGITVQSPQTRAGLNLAAGGVAKTITLNAAGGPESATDPDVPLKYPKFGNKCAIVNQKGNNHNVNGMSQTMTIAAGDIDQVDNQIHIRFVLAPVLDNPGHNADMQPYFYVEVTNVSTGKILLSDFNYANQPGVPWKTQGGRQYTDWQLFDISGAGVKVGDQVKMEVIGAGCGFTAHYGHVYVDSAVMKIPGPIVYASGPANANAGTNITYKVNYQNGGVADALGVKVDFNTPPNTTFVSVNAGALSCTSPAVGATGVTTCTIGTLGANASGTFDLTVKIDSGTTGKITAGDYAIYGTSLSRLIGPKVFTNVGCLLDPDCPNEWCKIGTSECKPKLTNGTAMPSDPPHTNPTLDAKCSASAASLVCVSGVCDTTDDKCGLLNGTGPCTVQTAGAVCRSAACGTDSKCGYPNGEGPCTKTNQGTVCRSLTCSTNGTCMPSGGCNVDGDCTAGNWCEIGTHTCKPTLPNGSPVPNDPPHTGPTLNGKCTAGASALTCTSGVCDTTDDKCGFLNKTGPCNAANGATVCRSSVCDPDLKCGYDVGNGPCTAANQATVCRSGVCSTNNKCMPAGGCNIDGDCTGGNWCEIGSHSCKPKVPNGSPIPTDPPHAGPTLNGKCGAQAATLTCVSGVCSNKDDKCGFLNDEGSCTAGNAATVCRSKVCGMDTKCGYPEGEGPCTKNDADVVCRSSACSNNGKCMPLGGCLVDADCPAGWCNMTDKKCMPKLVNGTKLPTDAPHMVPTLDSKCTADAAKLVCASGVCDTADDKCGYLNTTGPCTTENAATVCRSGVCDPDLKCGYADGNGPCTKENATAVCRSEKCSPNELKCMPADGCLVDKDCNMDSWCEIAKFACKPKLPNGSPLPKDPPHKMPTLDGECTKEAGALVCQSGVCDPDNKKCGLKNAKDCKNEKECQSGVCNPDGKCGNKDGEPCMSDDICRSENCGPDGKCVPPGGCLTDKECPAGKICDKMSLKCVTGCRGTGLPCAVGSCCSSKDDSVGTCGECMEEGCKADKTTKKCAVGCRRAIPQGCPMGSCCSSKDDTAGTCGKCEEDIVTQGTSLGASCSVQSVGSTAERKAVWLAIALGLLAIRRRRSLRA